jgi:hypothetical protein
MARSGPPSLHAMLEESPNEDDLTSSKGESSSSPIPTACNMVTSATPHCGHAAVGRNPGASDHTDDTVLGRMAHSLNDTHETHVAGAVTAMKDATSVTKGLDQRNLDVPCTMLVFQSIFERQATPSSTTTKTNPSIWLENYCLVCKADRVNDDHFIIQFLLIYLVDFTRAWLDHLS